MPPALTMPIMDSVEFRRVDIARQTGNIIKGRGAVNAPPGRFDDAVCHPVDDGWRGGDDIDAPKVGTIIRLDLARSVINKTDSPDIPHKLSANPYRGCEHGCVYCFARPSHAYLGLSPGLDFETRIFAKENAAELLRAELARPGYRPQTLALGINTDSYQPAERKLRITRRMLEVLAECRHPVSIITKSSMIERDIDILATMARDNLAEVAVSITSMDADLTRKLEPRAASPARRLKIIRHLCDAGIPVVVMMAPIIPAITDGEIETLLAAAADNGASGAGYVVLRLPHELKEVFRGWLHAHLPMRAAKVIAQLRQLHDGKDYNAAFFARQKGAGVLADLIASRFARAKKRYGLTRTLKNDLNCSLFAPPPKTSGQGRLSAFA